MKFISALLFSSLFLSSTALIAEDSPTKDSSQEDRVIATVNGQDIAESQLKIVAIQNKIDYEKINQPQKKQLTKALVSRQLLLEEAAKDKFDQTPEIAATLKALTDSYIASTYLITIAQEIKVDEKNIKAYYEKNIIAKTPEEYKARHILVKTEDEAKALIQDIQGGADFAKLAKEKSTDVGSGSKGGDLGWFSEQDMVAPLYTMVTSLKKGELGKTAVQSQFGWHVIILDDTRSVKPPEYKTVKDEIKKVLIKEALNQYIEDLKSKASIEIK